MPEREVSISTGDGECSASLHIPTGSGPWPAVLMYPDAGSLRDVFRDMGERMAGLGYVTLVPDIYYRSVPYEPLEITTLFSNPAERERLGRLVSLLNRDRRHKATPTPSSAICSALDEVTGSAVGTTGYCMGGGLSLLAAALHPDRVAAAAAFHGGNLAAEGNPDSPHLLAGSIKAEVYVAAAENDPSFPDDQYARLEQALTDAGVTFTMETYPAGHGFAVTDNPTYDPVAEQRHWDALAALYAKLPR